MPHVLIKFCSFEDWLLIVSGDRWIEEEKHSHKKRANPSSLFPTHTHKQELTTSFFTFQISFTEMKMVVHAFAR